MKKKSESGPEESSPGKKTLKCSKDTLAIAREAIRKHRKALELLKAYDESRPPKGLPRKGRRNTTKE